MKQRSHGAVHSPLEFERVAIPVIPAHDRVSMAGATVREMPDYNPFRFGRKGELARAWADTQPAEILS